MTFTLKPELKQYFSLNKNLFDQILALRGEVFRELEGRRTQRIMLGENTYFLKQHFGVGWREIFKNLLQLRLPIVGAKNEWQAIQQLQLLQIPTLTVVGYGERGLNPAYRQSFLLTEELKNNISLEDFCKDWKTAPPRFAFKCALIKAVASIARRLHEHGLNHRDFYLCHFLLENASINSKFPKLYLIDLHRAQLRSKTPTRWLIKDLAGLYFSSKDIGLTSRDLWRFIREYRQQPLRTVINKEWNFWQKVKQRGDKIYQQHEK